MLVEVVVIFEVIYDCLLKLWLYFEVRWLKYFLNLI